MCIKIGHKTVYITFSFAAFFALISNIAGGKKLLLTFLFSLLHEMIHIAYLHYSGLKETEIILLPAGVKIYCQGFSVLSYKKIFICSLSAPVFNIVAGVVFFFISSIKKNADAFLCGEINLILGIVNLLPMKFLDGGRATDAILKSRYEEKESTYIMNVLSVISLIMLFFLFFAGCIAGKLSFPLLVFCVYCFIGNFSDVFRKKNL